METSIKKKRIMERLDKEFTDFFAPYYAPAGKKKLSLGRLYELLNEAERKSIRVNKEIYFLFMSHRKKLIKKLNEQIAERLKSGSIANETDDIRTLIHEIATKKITLEVKKILSNAPLYNPSIISQRGHLFKNLQKAKKIGTFTSQFSPHTEVNLKSELEKWDIGKPKSLICLFFCLDSITSDGLNSFVRMLPKKLGKNSSFYIACYPSQRQLQKKNVLVMWF